MPRRDKDEPEMEKLNVRIPGALLRQLKKRAIDKDLKLQEAVREAVELWLKK
jgi:predicted DNA binding CopG/RHH family protein